MNPPSNHLALIGSGPSTIYLLKHILDEASSLKPWLGEISIFEKSSTAGMGMPYSPQTTDRYNLSNISSEELPELVESFADWLCNQSTEILRELDLENVEISDSEVYSRLALGRYLNDQYKNLIAQLVEKGIQIHEHAGCKVMDLVDQPGERMVLLTTQDGTQMKFSRVVIATGHCWPEKDHPEQGYFTSPWPISKLLPANGAHHDFAIGTLGASLSSFDVITSLSHRHGDFVEDKESGKMKFLPHPGTEDFKLVMHSGHGLLPHLQFDQVEPFREIYRHVDREGLLALIDNNGHLRLESYFNKVCRPALIKAFALDGMHEMVELMGRADFRLEDFVEKMTEKHEYQNAFEGMRYEMVEARKSVLEHKPIHWKEVIDDLVYTLNFHAELMPAEDHVLLQTKVMPFLMNVVAAMPLPSGNTILALYDAGKLEMVSGKASVECGDAKTGETKVSVEQEDGTAIDITYRMFIDCSGQKPLELEDYPFQSLVKKGTVRRARAIFLDAAAAQKSVPDSRRELVFHENGKICYHIGGVDIDGMFRLIGNDGISNSRIYDLAFPHTTGVRPYSYGLQACSDTSEIVVRAWLEEIKSGTQLSGQVDELTELYEQV